MGITTRIAPELDPAEVAALAGAAGLKGDKGDTGTPGEDALAAPRKRPVYKTTTTPVLILSVSQGTAFRILLTDDVELKFSGWQDGMKFSVAVLQDGTGGHVVTFPAAIRWPGAAVPTNTPDADKRDVFGFERYKHGAGGGAEDGYDGFVIGQNL